MKAMIGMFTTESNAAVAMNDIDLYDIGFGDECIRKMRVGKIFENCGVEMIPSVYASAGASGVVKRETFDYLEGLFTDCAKEHLNEIDGIYLMLHGASEVEALGSGDHHILKSLREIVGPYMPIAIACDPHGNLCKEYVEGTQVIRSYRESPHTDADETKCKVAQMLCDLLKERQNVHSIYRKLPLILGGEQSVSSDEPVKSINKYLDEIEKDPRIRSASWHVGYIRHDSPVAGCGIVVCPQAEADQEYAEKKADELAEFVWNRRHEFHYTGITAQPDEALQMVLKVEGKPAFITDSGDNVTSGATGWNTFILRQVLAVKDLKKSFLFANISDPISWEKLNGLQIGQSTSILLGMNKDENSRSVELNVTVKTKGELRGYMIHDHNSVPGHTVLVHVNGTTVDINVANYRTVMCEHHQFVASGIDWDNYDVIVVKQGYIFPELKEKGVFNVMSLTDGTTPQDTAHIPFKRIMRPMYPIDNI